MKTRSEHWEHGYLHSCVPVHNGGEGHAVRYAVITRTSDGEVRDTYRSRILFPSDPEFATCHVSC